MIDISASLQKQFPQLSNSNRYSTKFILYLLKNILREKKINQFISHNNNAESIDFIDKVLSHFNISYTLSSQDRFKIPSSGPLLIVANHPVGSLDGLVLLRLIAEIRPDVKMVVNKLLADIEPLRPLLLPVDNMTMKTRKSDTRNIYSALDNNEAIIIFPAGEVSRFNPAGVRDSAWNEGFLQLAKRFNADILPVHIGTRNSNLFYLLSTINKTLGTLLLAHEMFNKDHTVFPIKIGNIINNRQTSDSSELKKQNKTAKEIRHSVYQLDNNKFRRKKICASHQNTIYALPENRQLLKKELSKCKKLGQTRDGKFIYLYDYFNNSSVMREIGRLRELTFRAVGEGSGMCRDLDLHDRHYRHIVLWDDNDLEIVGAYRVGECAKLIEAGGVDSLYISKLFNINPNFLPYLENGIELGRSFIQPQYWGRRSLDYLWYGIGAYLKSSPQTRYMFGPVSISNDYSTAAKTQLVEFYSRHFPDNENLASAKTPFTRGERQYSNKSFTDEFVNLKSSLKAMGHTVPTLYKQYTEVCDKEAVRFIDFNIDSEFSNCIDGLILLEVERLKPASVKRYINKQLDAA